MDYFDSSPSVELNELQAQRAAVARQITELDAKVSQLEEQAGLTRYEAIAESIDNANFFPEGSAWTSYALVRGAVLGRAEAHQSFYFVKDCPGLRMTCLTYARHGNPVFQLLYRRLRPLPAEQHIALLKRLKEAFGKAMAETHPWVVDPNALFPLGHQECATIGRETVKFAVADAHQAAAQAESRETVLH